MSKIRIKTKRPWISYPGSFMQNNYAEDLNHGYLLWDVDSPTSFDVRFNLLPNPQPYVTIRWEGDVDVVLEAAEKYPPGTRYRIHSPGDLSQKHISELTSALRNECSASEVTFKIDKVADATIINAGKVTVVKHDLRNHEVMLRMIKDHHAKLDVSDEEWEAVTELLKSYSLKSVDNDGLVRNTKWTLKHIAFDNTFAYGAGNVIDFSTMKGVCGVFGANRVGKSSIMGTIMYALFNTTDRGSVKNMHVPNVRKPFCYTKAIVNVNGTDYVIERQTTKHENKKGQVNANTALNLFRIEGDEAVDLGGEQRADTEKSVQKLLGTAEDFLMTSLAAQDDIKLFITHGSSKRHQVLSRFLDLDVFDQVYDLSRADLNDCKAVLKTMPDRDWKALSTTSAFRISECSDDVADKEDAISELREKATRASAKLSVFSGMIPVTASQVDAQTARVRVLDAQVEASTASRLRQQHDVSKHDAEAEDAETKLSKIDVPGLKKRLEALKSLEASVAELRHSHERDASLFKQQERSLKILDDVPCGDEYPTCMFIKDAHLNKEKVELQKKRTEQALERLTLADESLKTLADEKLNTRVSEAETLLATKSRAQLLSSRASTELVKLETRNAELLEQLTAAKLRLDELQKAWDNDENVEVVSLRGELGTIQLEIKRLDEERMGLASELGRLKAEQSQHIQEQKKRTDLLNKMRAYELITSAFSKKGVPTAIMASQLPIINAEVAKVLHGIVDFTVSVELAADDSMEVYIDYGDSRRIIELCSGMEKTMASIAIRVAMINVSTLPKTDLLVIDEGFGQLDPAAVEACNRLLGSLKRSFSTVMVVTHSEGIKDAVDHIIEVTKVEKDSRVVHE